MTRRTAKPSIYQLGQVHDDGNAVTITGWGVGLCATGCSCHGHPLGGHLTLLDGTGTLGLVKHRPWCTCCEPWTAAELAALLRDVAIADALLGTS